MKKLFSLIFLVLLCLGICACDSNSSKVSYEDTDYEYNTEIITKSKAEGLAASALYRQLKALYIYIDDYDISQTKYSIASITGSSDYTVNGTYSLYDKYGNFKERNNFSVEVSSDGNARVTEY